MIRITAELLKKQFYDPAFRALFPDLGEHFSKFFQKPGCKCNGYLYIQIIKNLDKLTEWFGQDIELDQVLSGMVAGKNEWTVISGTIDEMEDILNALPRGPKTFAVARWENQLTIVIRDLDQIE